MSHATYPRRVTRRTRSGPVTAGPTAAARAGLCAWRITCRRKQGNRMTDKEKAAGVLPAPEAAIQKTYDQIMRRMAEPVNQTTMEQAMHAVGLTPFKDAGLVADGRVHRYRVEGDKPGSKNGWYVLHDAPHAGAFGSWKTGETHTWHEARATPPTA